jgi:hypothetical protein
MTRELFDRRERPLFGQADPLPLGPLPLDHVLADLGERPLARGLLQVMCSGSWPPSPPDTRNA